MGIFEILFERLRLDPTKYEIKLALLARLMPLMNKVQAAGFMKIIESTIGAQGEMNMFATNINPLRLSL